MRYIVTSFLLLLINVLQAQKTWVVQGYVRDADSGAALGHVSVHMPGRNMQAMTDSNGYYRISMNKPGRFTIQFSLVGYTASRQEIQVVDSITNLDIELKTSVATLEDVMVTGITDEGAEARKVRNSIMPVTILTAKQMENRASNLNELLARQTGVQIRRTGGIGSEARISIRGLEGKRVQIFIDGRPLNTPDGSLGINDLPLQIIERIEIYKGTIPAWLGGDGLGSAVNVVIRHRDVSYIDATASYQSYNTLSTGLILKKTFDEKGIEAGAGIFTNSSDNDYVMESPYQKGLKIIRDHDRFESVLTGGAARFHRWWFDEVEFEGAYMYVKKELQGIQNNIQHLESIGHTGFVSLGLQKKNFFLEKLDFRYNAVAANINVKLVDTSSFNYDWDGNRFASQYGKGELGVGPNLSTTIQKELRQQLNLNYTFNPVFNINFNNTSRYASFNPDDPVGNEFAGKNLFNYPGNLLNNTAGLTLERRLKGDKLLFSTAAKHYFTRVEGFNTNVYLQAPPDRINKTASIFGYNAGARYNFTPAFLIKVSYEKAVRLPNNAELFGDGILITPAIHLKPEVGHNHSIGLIYDHTNSRNKRLQAEVNGFLMYVDNLIQLSGNGLSLGYVNFAKAEILGADAEVKYDITKEFFASFNITWQQTRDINKLTPGTTVPNPTYKLIIPNTPQFFCNWNLEYTKAGWLSKESHTKFLYEGSYTQEYNYGFNVSVYDDFVIPSFLTHTFSIEQSFANRRYILAAEANNITDAMVINNFNQPLPGRTFRVKLRYLLLGKKSIHSNDKH
jgi:vitamin B12 transporter